MIDPENYLNPPEAATRESRYETLAVPMGPKLRATMVRLHREAKERSEKHERN